MSTEIHVVAIITPAAGKAERVKELLSGLASKVKANEPKVTKYQMFEQVNADSENVFVVEEIYSDQATFDAHAVTEYFQALGKTIGEESLLAGPLDIKVIEPFAGYASR